MNGPEKPRFESDSYCKSFHVTDLFIPAPPVGRAAPHTAQMAAFGSSLSALRIRLQPGMALWPPKRNGRIDFVHIEGMIMMITNDHQPEASPPWATSTSMMVITTTIIMKSATSVTGPISLKR